MSITVRTSEIWFEVEKICHECGRPVEGEPFNMDQIEEAGMPICPECGVDLHIEPFATVEGISV